MTLRVNSRQLLFLSTQETSANFQKEGTLRVGRQHRDLAERFCRLRGNLLFILKKQGGALEEVLLLERCEVMKLPDDDRQLAVSFDSGDPRILFQSGSSADRASWLVALRNANTETLRRRATHLRTLINTHTTTTTAAGGDAQHTHAVTHCSDEEDGGGAEPAAGVCPLHLRVGVVAAAAGVQVQVCVIDTHTHTVRKYCCAEVEQGADDGVFHTSVCFRGDCPLCHHSRIKVTVHHEETTHTARSFLGFTSFSLRDLLRSEEPHLSLSLRTMDGVSEVGEVMVSRLQVEGESDSTTPPEHKCPALCDSLHTSVHDKENSAMMRAVLCAQVCKVYRFHMEDQRWLLVREQMSETPLSFSLPKQLLSALIQEHRNRMQQVKELADLSPHWDGLRHDVVNHCNHLIGCYQETLDELDKLSVSTCFKSSGSKSDRHLQFVPTNLHVQRMEVTDPDSTGVWYEVITVGAPADHHQSFKHGGLKRLLRKHALHRNSSVSYSQDESSRARELLASVAQLQPLVFGLAEELLSVSLELNAARLQRVLDSLTQQTEQFVHALKDELVKSALLAIHNQRSSDCDGSHVHSNGLLCDNAPASQEEGEDAGQRDSEYDEEEWASWSASREILRLSAIVLCTFFYICVCVCVGQSVGQRRHEPQLHHRHGRPASGSRGPPTGADVTNGGRKLSEHGLLAGAAAPPGGHAEGLRARSGGDGPSRHDLRGPPGGGVANCRSGAGTHRPEAPRRLQPGALSGRVRLRVEAVWRSGGSAVPEAASVGRRPGSVRRPAQHLR
ncbi:Type II inositol 3,4-bisphosphate 4-phosphatase [Collichthys lucidus]|uniref:Type II inositol 3,4-bisphosphate 4-phosphatase n=1 Tax=Collichthys lucidus TaxID=240159 RepID=A0A4U5VWP8_COLLU|nr:Type II inositol 3,4-bisphosphate 4-phosphatase [Collichthys lucidus]